MGDDTPIMAIAGQFVRLGTLADGSVRVTIDFPIERLADVVTVLGQPGQSVAVARIIDGIGDLGHLYIDGGENTESEKREHRADERRLFDDLPPPQQAGIMCNEPRFRHWIIPDSLSPTAEEAAWYVRERCKVESRAEIQPHTEALTIWLSILAAYRSDTGQLAEER